MEYWNNAKRQLVRLNASLQYSSAPISVCRVSPGEYGFASSDGNPGTNGAIKNSQRSGQLSAKFRFCKGLVAGGGDPGPLARHWHHCRASGSDATHTNGISPRRPTISMTRRFHSPSTLSGSSLASPAFRGKCAANTSPTSPTASTMASEKCSDWK
jgi:hypothetical protein